MQHQIFYPAAKGDGLWYDPVFCVEPETLALAAFLLEGDGAEPSRPGLPEGLFRLVMLFLC